MKNVLLLGGTGAMGMYLAPECHKAGYQVYVTSRSERENKDGIIYLTGNAKNIDFVEEICKQIEPIAIFDFMGYSTSDFNSIYKQMLSFTQQYFFMSSYRAYGFQNSILTEDTPLKCDSIEEFPEFKYDTYGVEKGKQETILRDSGKTNWTIIRPTMTFSKNRFQFINGDNNDVIRSQKNTITAIPKSMVNKKTNITYGKDVALMLANLIEKKDALGEAFHPVSNDTLTWSQIANIYKEVFNMNWIEVDDEKYDTAMISNWATLIDRKLDRNFSNEKILSVTGINKKDLMSLSSGLEEAWAESDKERFKYAKGYKTIAKFDVLTDSYTNLDVINDLQKTDFVNYRNYELINFGKKINDYQIEVPNNYWICVEESASIIHLKRIGYDLSNPPKDLRWLNFRYPQIHNQSGMTISFEITADVDCSFAPFVHFHGQNIKIFDKIVLVKNKTVEVNLFLETNNQTYRHLSITGTDFPLLNTSVKIENLKVFEKILIKE